MEEKAHTDKPAASPRKGFNYALWGILILLAAGAAVAIVIVIGSSDGSRSELGIPLLRPPLQLHWGRNPDST